MKGSAIIGLVIIALPAGETAPAQSPAGTAFTYQGQLKQNGVPVNTSYGRFQFKLFDADTGGSQVGNTVALTGVVVVNGLFAVTLDFGAGVFNADARWLEIDVYDSGSGWVTLAPRQKVTPAPYALTAANLTLPFAATVPEIAADAFTIDYAGWGYAIRAIATGTDAIAIYGSTSAYDTVAIQGQATGLVSTAVRGYASASGPDAANFGGWFGAQGEQGKGVYGSAMATSGTNYGVYGRSESADGTGVYGYAPAASGVTHGVTGVAGSPSGTGVFGYANASAGEPVGVCGRADAPGGWAGRFIGRGYFSGNVGIGTTTPMVPLQVTDAAGGFAAIAGEKPGESSYGYLGHEFAGVYGVNDAAYAEGKAVYGVATGPGGFGGYFEGRGYFSKHVGIGTQAPSAQLDVVSSGGETAVSAWNSGESTAGALGHEFAGVYGSGSMAAYFEGNGYFSGNVGIGTTPADSALTVAGLIESRSGGIRFPDGTTQTTAATGGGDSFWEAAPDGIRYNEGYIGVGNVSNPSFPLHAASTEQTAIIGVNNFTTTSDGNGILAETSATAASAVYGRNNSATGANQGVLGIAYSPEGDGVRGANLATSGDAIGVNGRSHSTDGIGVYGYATAATGTTYGVYGRAASPNGFGGYFEGKGYFTGSVGIGTTSPSALLDVAGTVRADGFRLDAAPADGHVLTSDSSGNASWQAPSSFSLPYSGTVSTESPAFEVWNTGTSAATKAIVAVVNNPGSDPNTTAGYFTASGSPGKAIHARSSGGVAIQAEHTGSTYAYDGTSYGAGCANFTCLAQDGFGVKGVASAAAGVDTVGGWFESASSNGDAVYAYASGAEAHAVRAEVDGAQSTAVYATSPYRALYAASPYAAAYVKGDVRVYKYSGDGLVFEVDTDTGTTSVDVLHITGGADLAEKFAISEAVEPGLVVEIDPDCPGQLRIARGAYNRRVAGVISGANDLSAGMVLAERPEAENAQPIALSGRVWVHCDATSHAITPGDLLTTADRPGHAMAVTDFGRAHGAVLGKAMTALAEGQRGMVLVLVNLQ